MNKRNWYALRYELNDVNEVNNGKYKKLKLSTNFDGETCIIYSDEFYFIHLEVNIEDITHELPMIRIYLDKQLKMLEEEE